MTTIVMFPSHRTPAVSRAARATNISALRPALRATEVAKIGAHHSAGMDLRSSHLRIVSGFADMSEASAKREGHSPITSLNDFGASDMPDVIVQSVLHRKSEMSYDIQNPPLDNWSMDRMTESEETDAFIGRTKQAREAKFTTQKPVYEFLGVKQSHYKHWETKRPMPRRFIPKFCTICEISMEWLLTGEGEGPQAIPVAPSPIKRTSKRPRARAA